MGVTLREIRWPRSPLLVVVDFGARTMARYRGRTKVGGWDWAQEDDAKVDAIAIEEVRMQGAGGQTDDRPRRA